MRITSRPGSRPADVAEPTTRLSRSREGELGPHRDIRLRCVGSYSEGATMPVAKWPPSKFTSSRDDPVNELLGAKHPAPPVAKSSSARDRRAARPVQRLLSARPPSCLTSSELPSATRITVARRRAPLPDRLERVRQIPHFTIAIVAQGEGLMPRRRRCSSMRRFTSGRM